MTARRDVNPTRPGRRTRWTTVVVGGAILLAVGVGIGRQTTSTPSAVTTTTVTTTLATPDNAPKNKSNERNLGHTERGAVTAATTYLGVLDGPALLDSDALVAYVRTIAAPSSRVGLVAAYKEATAQVRSQLGLDRVPKPVVIVRAGMLGYHVDEFSSHRATVAVWRVGIIGSGANVDPQQSWQTETVSLVWEAGSWKVAALSSEPGPTPPLETTDPSTPVELFNSVPRFMGFAHAAP